MKHTFLGALFVALAAAQSAHAGLLSHCHCWLFINDVAQSAVPGVDGRECDPLAPPVLSDLSCSYKCEAGGKDYFFAHLDWHKASDFCSKPAGLNGVVAAATVRAHCGTSPELTRGIAVNKKSPGTCPKGSWQDTNFPGKCVDNAGPPGTKLSLPDQRFVGGFIYQGAPFKVFEPSVGSSCAWFP